MPAGGVRPGAGRPKGAKGKITKEIEEKLAAIGVDPIMGMAEISIEARQIGDLKLAGDMYKELAQYIAPKRKAIEVSGTGGDSIAVETVSWTVVDPVSLVSNIVES